MQSDLVQWQSYWIFKQWFLNNNCRGNYNSCINRSCSNFIIINNKFSRVATTPASSVTSSSESWSTFVADVYLLYTRSINLYLYLTETQIIRFFLCSNNCNIGPRHQKKRHHDTSNNTFRITIMHSWSIVCDIASLFLSLIPFRVYLRICALCGPMEPLSTRCAAVAFVVYL